MSPTKEDICKFHELYYLIEQRIEKVRDVLRLWSAQKYILGVSADSSGYIDVLTRYPDDDEYESHCVDLTLLSMSDEELLEEAKRRQQESKERAEKYERERYEELKKKYG